MSLDCGRTTLEADSIMDSLPRRSQTEGAALGRLNAGMSSVIRRGADSHLPNFPNTPSLFVSLSAAATENTDPCPATENQVPSRGKVSRAD